MLSVNNIYKKYNKLVLNNINLSILPGKLVGITGKKNSGKSTLLSIMSSTISADSGHVKLEDGEVIGYVPSENSLFEMLTVRDNLKFWSSVYKKDYTKLTFVNNLLDKKIKSLTAGLKKKVSIAIALISEPTYIIIDEPTKNLDISEQNEITNIIYSLKIKGKGIIFSSSSSIDLYRSDYIYVIDNGQIIYKNPPKSLGYSLEEFDKRLYETIKLKGML